MHSAAYAYVAARVESLRQLAREHTGDPSLADLTIIEVGSYNVNGSIRDLFAECASYTGMDRRPGPGVDVVSRVQQMQLPEAERVDLVISCEALEHDSDPKGHLAACMGLLSIGGHLIVTCASPERAPHGNDGGPLATNEDYGGIGSHELYVWLRDLGAIDVSVAHAAYEGDVYAFCTKGRA